MFLAKDRCPSCFASWGSSIHCPACGGLAEIYFERDLPRQDQIDPTRIQSMIEVARTRVYSHPNDGNARYMLGLNYVFLGLIDEGISELDIAAEIMPELAQIRYEAAALSAKQGRFDDKILREIDHVIEMKPEYKEAYFLKGVIQENRGDIGSAVKAWQIAYQLDLSYVVAETKLLDFIFAERDSLSASAVTKPGSGLQLDDELIQDIKLVCSAEPMAPPPLGGMSMSILTGIIPKVADKMHQMHLEVENGYTQQLALREDAWQHLEGDLVTLSDICLVNREERVIEQPESDLEKA